MYTYILGYPIDFGHKECTDLISCDSYSEKNVGYVGVSLLLIEHTDLLRLCIQSIKKDLNARNELYQCLALTCIANVGGVEFAESLMPDVQQLLISQASRNFVRKKAALCLLRLLRQCPDNIPPPDFAPEVIKLAEHRNVGVVTSVMSLISGLATYDPTNYTGIVPVAIRLLTQFVLQRECSKDYVYYRTPCPWLQVKLLRILQFYPPPKDKATWNKLHDILDKIVTKTEVTQSVNKNNADHAILFEAINVIIHLNMHGEDMLHDRAIGQLQKFIAVKEGNIRYLGLDAMARLAKISNTHKSIKKYLRTIQYSLDDNDISIRKRALDLLYSICDDENVVEIIDNLLKYLNKAEYGIREEMVLKIAILAEKYATDYQWYINVVLQLITVAGDFVSEDVLWRVIQIVTNNEDLQQYAADVVYENLQEPPVHEALIKVGGYILGEFGHVLSIDGKTQFELLQKHFQSAGLDTKALLLSTYMKFANMYEDLSQQILEIFEKFRTSIDPEIQQRAVEYKVMATYENQNLINQIWDAMPDFPERESNLIKLVKSKEVNDREPFSDGDTKEKNKEEEEEGSESGSDGGEKEGNIDASSPPKSTTDQGSNVKAQPIQPVEEDLLSGLFDMPATNTNSIPNTNAIVLQQDPSILHKMLTSLSSLIYEDSNIQIGMKSQVEFGGVMKIIFFYGNKAPTTIENITVQIENSPKNIDIAFESLAKFSVGAKQQSNQKCRVSYKQPTNEIPILKISYNIGTQNYVLTTKLPIIGSKFFQNQSIESGQFPQKWAQLDKEAQKVLKLPPRDWSIDAIKSILSQGMNLTIIENADSNPNVVVGCGLFHFNTKKQENFITMPILLKIEFNAKAQAIRVTIRSPNPPTSEAVLYSCEEIFH